MNHRILISFLSIVACTASLAAQNLTIGLVGGNSLTDAARDTTTPSGNVSSRVWSQSKDWIAGAALEFRFRSHFAVEVDGMYRELHLTWANVLSDGTLNSVSPSPVVTWEFPILAKYRFGAGGFHPFAEAGPAFRTTGNLNFYPSHYGVAAGAGIEREWRGWSFAPAVRYTRWAAEYGGSLRHNQVEILVTASRAANTNFNPMGARFSIGAIAGWGLTPDFSDRHTTTQSLLPIPLPGGGYTYTPATADYYLSGLRSLIAGPSFEVHFTRRISVEADILHKPLRFRSTTVFANGFRSEIPSSTDAATWQLPLLAKYRLPLRMFKPFVEGGASFRLPQGDLSTHGVTGGAGVDLQLRALRISPAVRFTHWGAETGFGQSGVNRNEAGLLVGFSLGGPVTH